MLTVIFFKVQYQKTSVLFKENTEKSDDDKTDDNKTRTTRTITSILTPMKTVTVIIT